jgi:hypothetical protein
LARYANQARGKTQRLTRGLYSTRSARRKNICSDAVFSCIRRKLRVHVESWSRKDQETSRKLPNTALAPAPISSILLVALPFHSDHPMPRRFVSQRRMVYSLRGLFLLCLFGLFVVLRKYSAVDVRSDSNELLFYMLFCCFWMFLVQAAFRFSGVSLRDDVVERGNPAAGLVVAGGTIAAACCIGGSNIGNGPGPEAVVFCLVLSSGTLLLFWLILDRVASVNDTITIERDRQAGLRLGAWLVATGAILGASVAGDWVSVAATTGDFLRYVWPVAILVLVMSVLERRISRRGPGQQTKFHYSALISVAILSVGLAYAAWVGTH